MFRIVLFLVLGVVVWSAIWLPEKKDSVDENNSKKGLHKWLGDRYYSKGKYKDSVEMYEKWLSFNPKDADIHLKLAILYDDYLSNEKLAIVHYKKHLELKPESEKSKLVRAWSKLSKEKSSKKNKQIKKDNVSEEKLIQNLKKEMESLKKNLDNESLGRSELEKAFVAMEAKTEGYRQLLDVKRERLSRIADELHAKNGEIDLISKEKGKIEKLLKEAMDDLASKETLVRDKEEMYKNEISSLKTSLIEDKHKIKDYTKSRNNALSKKGEIFQNYKRRIDSLENENIKLATEKKELKRELEAQKKIHNSLKYEYETQTNALKKNIDRIQASNQKVETRKANSTSSKLKRIYVYEVKKGDSLRYIAEKLYGDKMFWKTIYEMNRLQIEDPNVLTPGQKLRIPNMEGTYFSQLQKKYAR